MTDSTSYFEFIDKYCERTMEGMWAEPFNVVSNIVFVIVSLLLLRFFLRHFQGQYLKNWDIGVLIMLAFCISIGSTLWHIFAVRWALYADVIPILIFINLFLISCFIRILHLKILNVIFLFSVYQLLNYTIQNQFSIDTLNGSIFYIPILIMLMGIAFFLYLKENMTHHSTSSPQAVEKVKYLSRYYVVAAALFSLSLILRTLDLSQCENFPLGTHFLWHTFIGIMLYYLTMSLMINQMGEIENDDIRKSPA